MLHRLLILALLALPLAAFSATYTYTGPTYTATTDYTAAVCNGNCANYTAAMRQSGSFTTAAPLLPNLNSADISMLITSYSFSDGIHTISSADTESGIMFARIWTDGTGAITTENIAFARWQTAVHTAGARVDFIQVNIGSFGNRVCNAVLAGACFVTAGDTSSSSAFASNLTSWAFSNLPAVISPTSVPVNSPLALALMTLLVVCLPFARKFVQRGATSS